MPGPLANAAREIIAAQGAYRAHTDALAEFKKALFERPPEEAEAARLKVVASLEAYLDALMAASRDIRSPELGCP